MIEDPLDTLLDVCKALGGQFVLRSAVLPKPGKPLVAILRHRKSKKDSTIEIQPASSTEEIRAQIFAVAADMASQGAASKRLKGRIRA